MIKQRQAVESAILSVVGTLTSDLSRTQISEVTEIVTNGIINGEVAFSDKAKNKYADRSSVSAYVRTMVKNWLRRSPDLNNGQAYVPTRTGVTRNPIIKQLQLLKNQRADSLSQEEIEAIDSAIEAEKNKKSTSSKVKKEKVETIDLSVIPENLRHLIDVI